MKTAKWIVLGIVCLLAGLCGCQAGISNLLIEDCDEE